GARDEFREFAAAPLRAARGRRAVVAARAPACTVPCAAPHSAPPARCAGAQAWSEAARPPLAQAADRRRQPALVLSRAGRTTAARDARCLWRTPAARRAGPWRPVVGNPRVAAQAGRFRRRGTPR